MIGSCLSSCLNSYVTLRGGIYVEEVKDPLIKRAKRITGDRKIGYGYCFSNCMFNEGKNILFWPFSFSKNFGISLFPQSSTNYAWDDIPGSVNHRI